MFLTFLTHAQGLDTHNFGAQTKKFRLTRFAFSLLSVMTSTYVLLSDAMSGVLLPVTTSRWSHDTQSWQRTTKINTCNQNLLFVIMSWSSTMVGTFSGWANKSKHGGQNLTLSKSPRHANKRTCIKLGETFVLKLFDFCCQTSKVHRAGITTIKHPPDWSSSYNNRWNPPGFILKVFASREGTRDQPVNSWRLEHPQHSQRGTRRPRPAFKSFNSICNAVILAGISTSPQWKQERQNRWLWIERTDRQNSSKSKLGNSLGERQCARISYT